MDQVQSVILERGGAALSILERLCDETPPPQGTCFSEAIGELVRLRDQLIMAQRAGVRCGHDLSRTNAILSSVFGLEFPVSDTQRTRIREARDGIKDMLRPRRRSDDS